MAEAKLPNSASLDFVDGMYAEYLKDPQSVSQDWRDYFQAFSDGNGHSGAQALKPSFKPWSVFAPPSTHGNGAAEEEATTAVLQERVDQLIRNYRVRGHMAAQLDPLGRPRVTPPELDPDYYGLSEADMGRQFACEAMCGGGTLTLHEILERLRNTYCRTIGVQFMHIDDSVVRHWLQERMEGSGNRSNLNRTEQIRILTRLTDAVI